MMMIMMMILCGDEVAEADLTDAVLPGDQGETKLELQMLC